MRGLSKPAAFGLSIGIVVVSAGCANALDLNGAWVSDADNCAKVFVRQGSQFGFTDMSDVYGGGFIINGDQIVGKFARCRIKARKDSGPYVNLVAACATDIMLSSASSASRNSMPIASCGYSRAWTTWKSAITAVPRNSRALERPVAFPGLSK
jgi:hypothetical protein